MKNYAKIAMVIAMLMLFSITSASAAFSVDINVDKDPAIINEKLTVTISSNGPLKDIDVQFILNNDFAGSDSTDTNGRVIFTPEKTGTLEIRVDEVGYIDATKSITVTTRGGGGGGDGGGGGGGVVSGEPFDNIVMYITLSGNLIANTPVLYNFGARPEFIPALSIYEILVTGTESENDISLRVELLKGTSKLVSQPPGGDVYKNINIWSGSRRVKEALIRFKVNNTWLNERDIAGSEVKLLRWDGSTWQPLETKETSKDSIFTYFEAKTSALSPFAISAKVPEVVSTAAPTGTPTVTPGVPGVTPPVEPEPTSKAWIYALILIVVIAVAAAYFYMETKKKQQKK